MTFEEIEIQSRKHFCEVRGESERFKSNYILNFNDGSEFYVSQCFIQHVDEYTIVYALGFITPFIFFTEDISGFSDCTLGVDCC